MQGLRFEVRGLGFEPEGVGLGSGAQGKTSSLGFRARRFPFL